MDSAVTNVLEILIAYIVITGVLTAFLHCSLNNPSLFVNKYIT